MLETWEKGYYKRKHEWIKKILTRELIINENVSGGMEIKVRKLGEKILTINENRSEMRKLY